jgi:hypothetical protein
MAPIGMSGSALLLAASPAAMAIKVAVPLVLGAVGWWLWRRPET